MDKPVLPVYAMTREEFNNEFKRKHLDKTVLSGEDFNAIKEIFGLSDRGANSPVGRISCDEYHGHGYKCVWYNSPEAGIVDRLLNEIKMYKGRLEDVYKVAKGKEIDLD
jgi:hypothetical protein